MECPASLLCKPIAKEFANSNDREAQGVTVSGTPLKRRSSGDTGIGGERNETV